MIPRIEPAAPPYSPAVRASLERIMPAGMEPLKLFRVLAIDARLFERFMAGSLLDPGNLSLRHREIVIGRTTARSNCDYERSVHVTLFGEKAGFTGEQIKSVSTGSATDPCWDADERLLIQTTDSLCASCDIPDGLWRRLVARFQGAALLEVIMLVGFYRTVSCLANSLRLPLEPWAAANTVSPR
jgi:Carboxymuconolactone decarboxylase family